MMRALLDDEGFDSLLPDEWRARAAQHFTPAAVARLAAYWLCAKPEAWILDVGAGVGKFCAMAAAAVPAATFVGVERRPHLARVASTISEALRLSNMKILQADVVELDWAMFDGFYLFNPFAEHLRDNTPILDQTIELDPAYYLFYVSFVREQLAQARDGTRVVTYHGFGADLPPGYALARAQPFGAGMLELWIKRRGAIRRSGWNRSGAEPECA
jgi:hypothetical protein